MFDFSDDRYTHMPFAAHGVGGKAEEFCCIRTGESLWKLHHFTGSTWERVNTGLPEDATECGPTAELVDGKWRVSFIGGGYEGDRTFKLYLQHELGGESMVQQSADVGFVWKNRVCYSTRRGPIYIVDPGTTTVLTLKDVDYLYRVSYNPNRPSELLISGQYTNGDIFSWAYVVGLNSLKNILANGTPAYKCAFFNDSCWYAERVEGFEDRHIVRATTLQFIDLRASDFITETRQANNVTASEL